HPRTPRAIAGRPRAPRRGFRRLSFCYIRSRMAREPEQPRHWGANIWPLVTGLAVGFLVGRETGSGASRPAAENAAAPAGEGSKAAAEAPAAAKPPAKVYKTQGE